jgi:peptidoglycan/xylan/chitin deacetylase (PgdA/CDA1 family)
LREVVNLGHQVQSHGWSHTPLSHERGAELESELSRSKKMLEDHLGIPVHSLSLPHGRWNLSVLEACARTGYTHVFNSDPWTKPREQGGILLSGRLVVDRTMDAGQLQALLDHRWSSLMSLRWQQRIKVGLRNALGDRFYHALWCRLSGWTGPIETQTEDRFS